jgi:hypothetical protein
MRLESQQVLRHEIEAIAAVEGEPCPQRVAALCPEARKVEKSHDVARLQRRTVKSPSVRRPGCPRRPRCPCRSPLIAHRCSWCTLPQVVLVSKRTDSLSLFGTFPRKALGVLFFSEQMHEAEHGLVGRYGAQTSLAACDRRAKTALTGSCQTRHFSRLTQEARSRSGSACSVVE